MLKQSKASSAMAITVSSCHLSSTNYHLYNSCKSGVSNPFCARHLKANTVCWIFAVRGSDRGSAGLSVN